MARATLIKSRKSGNVRNCQAIVCSPNSRKCVSRWRSALDWGKEGRDGGDGANEVETKRSYMRVRYSRERRLESCTKMYSYIYSSPGIGMQISCMRVFVCRLVNHSVPCMSPNACFLAAMLQYASVNSDVIGKRKIGTLMWKNRRQSKKNEKSANWVQQSLEVAHREINRKYDK